MLHITPKLKPIVDVDVQTIEDFCKILFSMRRKTVETNLRVLTNYKDIFEKANLTSLLSKRPQDMSVEEICKLAKAYKELQ